MRSFAEQLQKMPDMRLPASYTEIMQVVACTKNKAKKMWNAIEEVPEMMRVPSGNLQMPDMPDCRFEIMD